MSERWKRIIPGILVSSWILYVCFTWRAWHTLAAASPAAPPDADRLWLLLGVSGAQMLLAAFMMLPRWRRWYPLRALLAGVILLTVAVLLRPVLDSAIDRVYLQWIAVVSILLLNVSLVASFLWIVQRYADQLRK